MSYSYKHLDSKDVPFLENLMKVFGEAFKDNKTYQKAKPSPDYIKNFLSDATHIVLVATKNSKVIGGLVAYELKKFEQQRSEIYIYDLAVSKNHQRNKVATSLIENLKIIAKDRGDYVIFVQADKADKAAISFYKTLSMSDIETHNFDIVV